MPLAFTKNDPIWISSGAVLLESRWPTVNRAGSIVPEKKHRFTIGKTSFLYRESFVGKPTDPSRTFSRKFPSKIRTRKPPTEPSRENHTECNPRRIDRPIDDIHLLFQSNLTSPESFWNPVLDRINPLGIWLMGDSLLVMDNNSQYVYMVIVKWMTVKKLDSAGLFQKIYKK
jgi:hypothetical protein